MSSATTLNNLVPHSFSYWPRQPLLTELLKWIELPPLAAAALAAPSVSSSSPTVARQTFDSGVAKPFTDLADQRPPRTAWITLWFGISAS